jgi:aspartyl-tRNA(Asn)/glutamyl-tRNA(Gln) amidotransferase subunit B
MAKSVLAAMLSGDTRPVPEISKELFYSGDEGASVEAGGEGEGRALAATCADVVGSMPDQVELLRGGKTRLMGLFVGEVMKRTKGRADPRRAAEIIKSLVDQ